MKSSAVVVFLPTSAIRSSLCQNDFSFSLTVRPHPILIPLLSAACSHLASREVAHSPVNCSTESQPEVGNSSSVRHKHPYGILVVFPLFHPTGSHDHADIRAKQERLSVENQCGLAAGERSSTGSARAGGRS